MTKPDFTVEDHGSIVLLTPHSEAATAWVEEHLTDERTTLGPSIAVERRFIGDIAGGIIVAGLTMGAA